MIVAIASGKGGTGKTTVACSLASIWERPVVAVDLDVEEPNLHLFLRPQVTWSEQAGLEIPVADESKCSLCRKCSELCQYKAISVIGKKLLVFPELCHGCGGCLAICPEGVLKPGKRIIGTVEGGRSGDKEFLMGKLRVGEAMSPPLIREVKRRLNGVLEAQADAILDCPPGVSCPAVSAAMDSDVILLVTEPTPFGCHDFVLAFQAFAPLGKPMGVVINRSGMGDGSVEEFCRENALPVLCEIPYDRVIAEGYAMGTVVANLSAELGGKFLALRDALESIGRRTGHA